MTEAIDLATIPEAETQPGKKRKFSPVWIIPIVAALVALGIAVQRVLMEGPTITIVFQKAEGIEAGKTLIKYKDVEIGRVTKVSISKDFRRVVVKAKIDKSAEGLLVADAKFWIESPRASLSGVSGLSTLLSGNYIGLEPGTSTEKKHEFTGLEVPPSITFDEPGKRFVLQAPRLGSIGNGSPVYYRQLNVGKVTGYDLGENGQSVKIEIFVKTPYDKYVTDQTRFWQASGMDMVLGPDGIAVHTQSLLAMLIGGIGFETPAGAEGSKPASENTAFSLFTNYAEAMSNPESLVTPYVLYFNESLRGLNVGAAVVYLGLPVGAVTAIGLEYNEDDNSVRPRVDIEIYPRRFMAHVKKSPVLEQKISKKSERRAFLETAVSRGMRAQLRTANLVTGQRFVAFDLFPDALKVKVDWSRSPAELPVMASGMQDLEAKITSLISKIDRIPMDEIVADLKKLLAQINGFVKRADTETMPEVKSALQELKRVLANVDANLAGNDAPTQHQLREALKEITKAAQGVRGLTDYLERNPEALLRGKAQEKR